jgi:hypothetical protein
MHRKYRCFRRSQTGNMTNGLTSDTMTKVMIFTECLHVSPLCLCLIVLRHVTIVLRYQHKVYSGVKR